MADTPRGFAPHSLMMEDVAARTIGADKPSVTATGTGKKKTHRPPVCMSEA
jgi:hypothetical protein